jgi:hypothetical protein
MCNQSATAHRAPKLSEAARVSIDAAAASLAIHGRSFARRDVRTRAARAASAQAAAFPQLSELQPHAQERAVHRQRIRVIGHRIHRVVSARPDYRSTRARAVLLGRLRIALGRELLWLAATSADKRRAG